MSGTEPSSTTYIEPLDRDESTRTVLIVGLDRSVRRNVGEALVERASEVAVRSAATTATALEQLAEDDDTIDCIVTGDSDAAVDGLELLRTVRGEYGQLPCLVCTDDRSELTATEAVNAGADGYFSTAGAAQPYEQLADRMETVVDQYRSETRVHETSRLLSQLTEYTTDALWMFTGDWTETVIANSAYEQVWGRSIDALVDDPADFLAGVAPRDRDLVTSGMETLSGGDPAEIEFRVDTDADEERWVSVHAEPVFDDEGDIEYVAGFTRNITDLKRRERGIRSLNEATTELLHVRSRDEVGRTVTEIVDSVLGLSISTVRSTHTDEPGLVPLSTTDATLGVAGVERVADLAVAQPGSELYEQFDRGESALFEGDAVDALLPQEADIGALLVVPLGEHGTLTVGTRPGEAFEEFERSLLEILGRTATAALDKVERDIELEAHRTELERSNENLQQFAYVASHDLQEPLRMVASYVDLLESEYGDELDEEASEYMEFAVDGARRMQDMIDALLQYARVQTRAQELEAVDPNAVVDDTLDSLKLQLEETDATVSVGTLPPVRGDENQLGQVFQNLLKNAITYTDETGRTPQIEIDAVREDGTATFSITDNGPGIDEQTRDDVFEIFQQGGVHESEGTGIGLAVCRRIVNRHDGEIWVESAGENGTTFKFTVPATAEEPA